ncbi:MAG TPA: hypothetical protein DIS79_11355 [Bacteroidetes bacterium]|nr:hypothetical protein [Bacteroidota bacterium]
MEYVGPVGKHFLPPSSELFHVNNARTLTLASSLRVDSLNLLHQSRGTVLTRFHQSNGRITRVRAEAPDVASSKVARRCDGDAAPGRYARITQNG